MFRKRPPKWVLELPNGDTNKELLLQLFEASKNPLETPREVTFAIKNLNAKDAENATLYMEDHGWETQINVDNSNPNLYWAEAKKNQYKITEDILNDEIFFVRLAKLYGGIYDGWYAQVV